MIEERESSPPRLKENMCYNRTPHEIGVEVLCHLLSAYGLDLIDIFKGIEMVVKEAEPIKVVGPELNSLDA